jgi:hypothetical protein
VRFPLATALAAVLLLAAPAGHASAPSAADLVARVRAARQTRGFTMRAKLTTTTDNSDQEAVVQIRALGRRDSGTVRVLYQALWPAAVKGQAAYIRRDGQEGLSGFLFQLPETLTPLTPELMSGPFLDSAMVLEDLAEDFWNWPDPFAAGQATVEGHPCLTVDLRPPAGVRSPYERIRSCIWPERSLPLSVEKIGKGGRVARRFVVKKAIKGETGHWTPVKVAVEEPDGGRTTMIEVSRGKRDVTVPLPEFSLEKIKSLGRQPRK